MSTDTVFSEPSHVIISQLNEKLDSVKSSVATDGHFAPNFNLLRGTFKKVTAKNANDMKQFFEPVLILD